MVGGEDEGELTLEEFIALLRYINDRVEALNREISRYQRNTRRMGLAGPGGFGFEDIMRMALAGSLQAQPGAGLPAGYGGEAVDDELVRERAKRLARRLARGGEEESADQGVR